MATKKPIKKDVTKKHLAREQREARQNRIIIITAIAIGVIILGLVLYGVVDQAIVRPRTPVARVGDETIRVREFETFVQYSRVQQLNQSFQYFTFHQQFGEFGGNFLQNAQSIAMQLSQPVTFGRQVLDEMIDGLIIQEEAEKMGITVSDAEIEEALKAAFGFFPDGTPTPTITATIQATPTFSATQLALINTPTAVVEENGDDLEESPESDEQTSDEVDVEIVEDEMDTQEVTDMPVLEPDLIDTDSEPQGTPEATPTVTLTPTPYTTAIFGQNIRDFNRNYSIYNFDVNNLREIIRIQLLRDQLIEKMDFDIETVKNEVWARHILVESLDEANEVLARLDEGENFFDLAALYSLDESNKFQGGDLGWFDENMMVFEFSEVAFSLDEGEISAPVETTFGFHIIQLIGKRESQVLPAQLAQQRQQAFNEWLVEQRTTRDDIIIYDGWDQFVPISPEVPQQYLAELFQTP